MKMSHVGSSLCLCVALLTACAPSGKKTTVDADVVATAHQSTDNIVYFDTKLTGFGSDAEALKAILAQNERVLIDFYADWCGPCKNLGVVIERIASKHSNVVFLKINYDKHKALAAEYGARSLPTLVYIKNGQKVLTRAGGLSASELSNMIMTYLG